MRDSRLEYRFAKPHPPAEILAFAREAIGVHFSTMRIVISRGYMSIDLVPGVSRTNDFLFWALIRDK